MLDWQELLKEASGRVDEVARRLFSSARRGYSVGIGASGDTTLLVDREAEREAIDVISQQESTRIISEEKGELGGRDARWVVLIDPIDGSSNFQRGIPFYCTSFAVLEGERLTDARYALVKNLINRDIYWAERGEGAEKNGERLSTSGTKRLEDSLLTIDTCAASLRVVSRLSSLIASVRRQIHLGANALELCYIAEGKVDGFVDLRSRTRVTDFAGGYLLAKEAGGILTSDSGVELDPKMSLSERFSFVASATQELHRKILSKL